jgi:hypothetical protein
MTLKELNPVIEIALKQIDFVERYRSLSDEYNEIKTPLNERLRYIDGEIIIESVENLGYTVGFNSKEKFFLQKTSELMTNIKRWLSLI